MAMLRAPKLNSFPDWLHCSANRLLAEAQTLARSLVDPQLSEAERDEQAQLLKPTSARHCDWVGFVATLLLGELWQPRGAWAAICSPLQLQASSDRVLKDAFVRIVVRQALILRRTDVDDVNKVHKHGNIISRRQVALDSELPTVRQVLELALLGGKLRAMGEEMRNGGLLAAAHAALHPVHREARNFHGKTPVQRSTYKRRLGVEMRRALGALQCLCEQMHWMSCATRLFVRGAPEARRDLWLVLARAAQCKDVPVEDLATAVISEQHVLDEAQRKDRLRAFRSCLDMSLATYNAMPRVHLVHAHTHSYKRPRDAAGQQLSVLQTAIHAHNATRYVQPRYSAEVVRMLKTSQDLAHAFESTKRRKL